MHEKAIILTNNALAYESLKVKYDSVFIEGTLMDVLINARDMVHKGHRLLTHPLMGSIKPNETPYKTVALSFLCGNEADYDSLMLIENSISTASKLLNNRPLRSWPESVLADFRVIDYSLINNAINN